MREKSWGLRFYSFFRKRRNQIVLLTGITVIVLLLSFWNLAVLGGGMELVTGDYCEESTKQMSDSVKSEINANINELVNVADSVSRVFNRNDLEVLEELLIRKAGILDFDALFLLERREENCIAQVINGNIEIGMPELQENLSASESFSGKVQVRFTEDQLLFYSTPVYMKDGPGGILVGIRSKENMQKVLSSDAFDGNTLSCIVDSGGGVVLPPTEVRPFTELDSIFRNDKGETSKQLRQMLEDMTSGKAGTVRFTDVKGQENMMAYNPLKINDWFLLTIVPRNLMAGNLSSYFAKMLLVVIGNALLFLIILLLIYRLNNDNQKELMRLAFQDDVTGGKNNAAFRRQYNKISAENKVSDAVIILMNIRHFKIVNERLGYEAGNRILTIIDSELEKHMDTGKNEFAARSEMDNFFVFLKETSTQRVWSRVEDIRDDINLKVEEIYPGIHLDFDVGCCLTEDGSSDIRLLQDHARLAAEVDADAIWEGCTFYSENIADRIRREQILEASFEDSIEDRNFHAYFQPKVNLKTKKLMGAEALVRWDHPQLGMVSPNEFVPFFERRGKICRLDLYIFEEVCRFYQHLKKEGKPWYPVSVNLSRYHFHDEGFLEKFHEIHRKYRMPEKSIEFELTESMFVDENYTERIKKSIDKMHQIGFLCSMDDFGSGYSSLGILKEFDVDTLKLDKSFFMDMKNGKARDIICSVVELASKLKMKTVAEGIEDEHQMEFLHDIDCDAVQGYFFSKPLPMDEFERWAMQYDD